MSAGEHSNPGSTKNVTEHIVLMSTNRGLTRPLAEPNSTSASLRDSKKKQKVQSHDVSGQRTKYFGDDDKYSLKQLVRLTLNAYCKRQSGT